MKSLANSLLSIAHGICEDIRVAYPQYRGLDLDRERLALNCRTRGLGFFTLDLPSLDPVLVRGLDDGFLTLKGPLCKAVSKRVRVPKLFRGLWLKVFDRTGALVEEPDVNAILFLRQIFCLGKKVELTCTPARIKKAVEAYHDIESELAAPTLQWTSDELDPDCRLNTLSLTDRYCGRLPLFESLEDECDDGGELSGLLDKVQQVADLIIGGLPQFHQAHYSMGRVLRGVGTGFRHGPGAVADRRGKHVNKYDMPRWSTKLELTFPYRQCGTIASDVESMPIDHEVASRLLAVPKTAKAPRLIASEPTEHQFCQQLISDFLVRELDTMLGTSFICFRDQSLSGEMALRASLDRSLATIDLSSASDRLSCWTVERIFRKNYPILRALHAARTRYIRVDIKNTGGCSFIKLKKFASQGTATTFPVQSMVFLIIALGCSIEGKVSWPAIRRMRSKVRVFGDDIIVPNSRYAAVTEVLHALGLKVNVEKSFHKGYFRESCGVDAYRGYDITPVKPQSVTADDPRSRLALVEISNNLYKKGFWHATSVIESALGDRFLQRLPIVGRDCGPVGRRSYVGGCTDHLKTRWNDTLHRQEWRVWTVKSGSRRLPTGERFALLQYFTEAPNCQPGWQHGIASRAVVRDNVRWDPLY